MAVITRLWLHVLLYNSNCVSYTYVYMCRLPGGGEWVWRVCAVCHLHLLQMASVVT